MNTIKRVSALALSGAALALAFGQAHGMGLGRSISRAVLGEPLRVSIPLLLEDGESVGAECVAVEIFDGDNLISPSKVQTSVSSGDKASSVQIRSSIAVLEPVVTVNLTVGCQFNLKRQFVFLADPPASMLADVTAAPSQPLDRSRFKDPLTETPVITSPVAEASTLISFGSSTGPSTGSQGRRPQQSSRGTSDSGSEGTSTVTAKRQWPMATAVPVSSGVSLSLTPKSNSLSSPRLVLDPIEADASVKPELRMSSAISHSVGAEELVSPEVQQRRAAAAALWQAMNLSPEEVARDRQKLIAQERLLESLQKDVPRIVANQSSVSAVTQEPSDHGSPSWSLYALGLAALTGVGLSIRFLSKMRKSASAETDWRPSNLDEGLGDIPSASDVLIQESLTPQDWPAQLTPQASSDAGQRAKTVGPPADRASLARETQQASSGMFSSVSNLGKGRMVTAVQPDVLKNIRSTPLSVTKRGAIEPMRAVSVEELIDLEQQADFFVVLGQDDAAVDLLESHIGSVTASPLLFLKLLEIYQRLDRHEDYERVQGTFNQRFNAHAPEWGSDLQHGHELADYPEVIARLQALWPAPLKAMEVLEKSLSRPDTHAEAFDLPAYRELLLLYAVASDLSEREVDVRPRVDLFDAVPGSSGLVDADPPMLDVAADDMESEPLMATRPVKAVPNVQPTLSLDLQLDELAPPVKPIASTAENEMEHIDLPNMPEQADDASGHKP